jgi:hypothetical protein
MDFYSCNNCLVGETEVNGAAHCAAGNPALDLNFFFHDTVHDNVKALTISIEI